jgi:hypothetical protein
MPLVNFHNTGALGIIQDIPAYELPPEAWSDGLNVRAIDNSVVKFLGHEKVLDPPTVIPYAMFPAFALNGAQLFAYTGIAAVYGTDGSTHTDITRTSGGAYTGAADDLWNGGLLGNILILNNGVDAPQAWIAPSLGTDLIALANWPASTIAKVIRPFRRFLVAYDVTKSAVRDPQLVKWSDRADIGAVPGSWDETDPTERTGEWPLLDTDGAIMDALALGGVNYVYKEDEIVAMEEVGGNFVFRFTQRFNQVGLLAQRCVKEYHRDDRHVHVLMTPEDIVQHDGFQMTSVLNRRMRNWYRGRIDPAKASLSFLAPNYSNNEMWAAITEAGKDYPNLALVINMSDGTLMIRELPNVSDIALAQFDPEAASSTFDSKTTPFDSMIGQFGQRSDQPGSKKMIMVEPDAADPSFYLAEKGVDYDGVNFRAFIERTGLAVVGEDRHGNPKVNPNVRKLVTEVWPKIRVQNGTSINVYVGAQDHAEGPVVWSDAMPFDPTTEVKIDVDPPIEGRYIAVRFETPDSSGMLWRLDSYSLELHVIGEY